MAERARIRFNPVTKEIEIEGTESFVKAYFQKIQASFSGLPAPVKTETQVRKKTPPEKKAGKPVEKARREPGKKTYANTVTTLIRDSEAGITTAALKEKTGLSERQIWGIIYRAEQQGKVKKTKRGLYVAA